MARVRVYIGLGANLGDRASTIDGALSRLNAHDAISVVSLSRLYETKPVGGSLEQPYYLNAAAGLDTALSAGDLLRVMLDVEAELGREREEKWGPRTIDLDLLLYGDQVLDEPDLAVPHPRMHERGFVLGPLVEIAPYARHPVLDKTVAELLQSLEGVKRVQS